VALELTAICCKRPDWQYAATIHVNMEIMMEAVGPSGFRTCRLMMYDSPRRSPGGCMIRKRNLIVFAVLLALPAVLIAQDAMTALNNAAKAMGIDSVKTLQYTATGSTFSVGQSFTPGGPYPRFTIKKFVRDLDLDSFSLRQEFVTTRADLRGGGLPIAVGAEQNQVQYINQNSAWPAHVFLWLNPPGFIKGAMMNNPVLSTQTIKGRRYKVVTVKIADKYTVRGLINDQNILERVETALDNHIVLGDAPLDADFLNYKDFGGVKFPSVIRHKMGLQPAFEFLIADLKANVPVNTQPPQPQRGAGGAGGGQAAGVQIQKVAEGVYYITGGTHYSAAVEFKDHIIIIDAPLSAARSQAVIGEVKKQIPNKPIRYVINTHHHFDHSNGLRTYVEEGATIVTHPLAKAFYEKWWARDRTLVPDKMSQTKQKATFETVSDKKIFTDGNQTLEIYALKGNIHADGMLFAYLPKQKILDEADVYTPVDANAPADGPADDAAMCLNLVQNIERLKLDVEQVLPTHGPGKVATKADLYKAAGKGASSN
jgi:glyoxylase-like metal-dependent hydrolase (beta-lactamase superfamily II)